MNEKLFETNIIPELEAETALRSVKYTDVLIDIDSCLTAIEGIDELARIRGVGPEVEELTRLAMEGIIPLEEVFARRLDMINPRMEDLYHVGALCGAYLTRDSMATIDLLHEKGVNVHLLSGGFDIPARILARDLGISYDNLYTNKLFFENNRDYVGFDKSIPLWQSHGKKEVIKSLRAGGKLGKKVAIIGDGSSELDASNETEFFIGFGAHAWREKVELGADVFVNSPTFSVLLPFLLDEQSLIQIATTKSNRGVLGEAFSALTTTRFNHKATALQQDLGEIGKKLALMYR